MDIYLVGGAVRDKLLGYPYHEKDWVVVGATAEELISEGFKPVGKDFPVFLHPQTNEEYALARTERKTAPGYAGFVFHSSPDVTLEQDLVRRDLTINAMAATGNGAVIDPYGGQTDIQKRQLRHVSPAFTEDPVRVLRIARFKARYHHLGFSIAEETQQLLQKMVNAGEVDYLVPERAWKELLGAIKEQSPEQFLLTLHNCGALQKIMPELMQEESATEPVQAALNTFKDFCEDCADSKQRFAAMVFLLISASNQAEKLASLSERMGVPKDYRELASLTVDYYKDFANASKATASQLVALFKKLDAYRRTERFTDWLQTCAKLETTKTRITANKPVTEQPVFTATAASSATTATTSQEKLWRAFQLCQQVSPQALMEQGIQGKQLGEAIETKREELLITLLMRGKKEC